MRTSVRWRTFAGIAVVAAVSVLLVMSSNLTREHIHGFKDDRHSLFSVRSWKAYGGSWELSNGVMRDNSYERGAKLITGSKWSGNYRIDADVALVGNYGDAGIILRAQDLEEGVDSYSGFNVGLRTLDNSLIIGRADFGWDEYQRLAIPGNIATSHFYHLTVVAIGCAIGAKVDLPSGEGVRAGVSLRSCNRRGQVGLKSYQTPAAWRNFRVLPASRADLDRLMNGTPLASSSRGNLHFYDAMVDEQTPIEREALSRRVEAFTTPISQLQLSSSPTSSQRASVHGVVRLIKPVTYVEDSTGSIVVSSSDQPALAIGDEVVISGEVSRQSGQLELSNGHVQVLWSDTPAPPLLVTADEAATGSRDGRLVLVEGTFTGETKNTDGSTVLQLMAGGETFRAIAASDTFTQLPSVRPSSEVQVTGVLTSDSRYSGDGAFAILLSPSEAAIRVVHEAPWWTTGRIVVILLAAAMLSTVFGFAYHRLKERYLLQVMKERELLAHDLHDTVSQSLTGIGFQLSSAASYVPTDNIAHGQIDRARVMVSQSHEELRRSVTTLRNQIAAIGDLAHALKSTALKLIAGGGIEVECKVSGVVQRLPVRVADCFFRVGQEALSNAVHHSQASLVSILVTYDRRTLKMKISDNGNGFCANETNTGHGIFGMKRRAEMIGARFELIREAQGTTIVLEKPLHHSERLFDIFVLSDFHDT